MRPRTPERCRAARASELIAHWNDCEALAWTDPGAAGIGATQEELDGLARDVARCGEVGADDVAPCALDKDHDGLCIDDRGEAFIPERNEYSRGVRAEGGGKDEWHERNNRAG